MARKFQIKRGLKTGMPTLAQGEFAMTTDAGSEGVFIGTGTENIELAKKSDLDAIPTPDVGGQINTHNSDSSAHSDIRSSITTHTSNTSIHVTSDQKTAWDAKATTTYVDQKISEIPTPDVSGQISTHNTNTEAHNDIRELITGLTTRLNALADSDDTTLDQLSEIVAYIKNNKSLIDGITTSKVNVADIINNLTTNVSNKPLSAAQGVALKALIDAITVPTKVSELTNDSGYLTSFTETDPTVPAWAKAESKPSYTASEVGAAPASHASDSTVHVTSEEKTAWNAKADAPFKPAGKSYLTFSSPNSFTLKVNDTTKHWNGTLEYFTSNKTWTTWNGTTTISSVDNDGEHVLYLRGTGNTVITGNNTGYGWVLTGSDISCIGNIEYLLDYATVESGNHPTMAPMCYYEMFKGCTSLAQAPALPATTLATSCYSSMFNSCTGLTQAPALPATTLAEGCYSSMFQGCTSLAQAPTLPATTLAIYCYTYMFRGCTSLAQAPALPSTTLASSCYNGMFSSCKALTKAPALPATTLATSCYSSMFNGCTGLTQAPALPATTLADYCYQYMFSSCKALTKAPALPATTLATSCYSSMFNGCTGLTQAPALPATTLADYCYQYMFSGCTALTQAPALPVTTLAERCYYGMLSGCTSLKLSATQTGEYTLVYRIPMTGTGTTASEALTSMFDLTGGTFTGTPGINTTYYLSSDNMIVRDTEVATLNGYVGSMIDAAHSYGTEDLEAGTSSLETGKLYFVYE